eukprot:2312273-Prymnesium_polylepis.3
MSSCSGPTSLPEGLFALCWARRPHLDQHARLQAPRIVAQGPYLEPGCKRCRGEQVMELRGMRRLSTTAGVADNEL